MNVYITGDPHGDFRHITQFCQQMGTSVSDLMIILGDCGLNYSGDLCDDERKKALSRLPMTFFCLQGNHDLRPRHVEGYRLEDWHGGKAWRQERYPNLLFPEDGEIFDLGGRKTFVIGGAYSVDKAYRLRMGYRWFPDEQPSEETKARAETKLEAAGWDVDLVLSHTCPAKHIPTEAFMPGVDQAGVDRSTEEWLDTIEDRLRYKEWYCGHWHINKKDGRLTFLFHSIRML